MNGQSLAYLSLFVHINVHLCTIAFASICPYKVKKYNVFIISPENKKDHLYPLMNRHTVQDKAEPK